MKQTQLRFLLGTVGVATLALLSACQSKPKEVQVTVQVPVTVEVPVTVAPPAEQPTETAPTTFDLEILHTSEIHGHWEPFAPFGQPMQGGVAARKAVIDRIRAENPNTLLVDSGDISQGTLYFSVYQGSEGRDLYNLMGYDAVTLGNHEFDLGPEVLATNFVDGATFSIVSANVDFTNEPTLAGKIPAYVVKEVGGEKIGIIGVMHNELAILSRAGDTIGNSDPAPAVQKAVDELTAQGVNKIVVLSHIGYQGDIELANAVPGIDVIASGHTSTLLGNPEKLPAFLGTPVGEYPTVAGADANAPTLIVHAYEWGRLLGDLKVSFNPEGVITAWSGDPIYIGEDLDVSTALSELQGPLEEYQSAIVGQAAADIDGERASVRNGEAPMGNLVADAMLAATASDKTQIALANGGGIRASLTAGDISVGNILTVHPFANRLVQFDLTGADLKLALENAVSKINLEDPGESAGRFLQVAGIRFTADLTQEVGSRITVIEIGNDTDGWTAISDTESYRVVTNDFLYGGGDGFDMFVRGTNFRGGDVPLEEALIDYITTNSPVSATVTGRITLIKP